MAAALVLYTDRIPAQVPNSSPAEKFIEALTATRSEHERARLIAANPQFATGAIAEALRVQGFSSWQKGDFQNALPLLEAAAQLADAAGDRYILARAINNIGIIHGAQGRYAEALRNLQRSLALWEELKEEERAIDTTMNIGNVFRWQRDFDQALAIHHRVLEYGERKHDRARIGRAAINIGFILVEKDELEAAGRHFLRAIDVGDAIDPRSLSIALNGMSDILMRQSRFGEALNFLNRALDLQRTSKDPVSAAYTLAYLAWLHHRQGRTEDAIRHAEESLALADGLALRETIWRAAYTLGAGHLARNQPEKARLAFSRSIAAIEQMREEVVGSEREQQRFFSDKLYPYHGMVELLISQGNTAEALDYAERAKARVLLDVASSGRARVQQAMTPEERARETELRRALAAAAAEVQRLAGAGRSPSTQPAQAHRDRERARLDLDRFQTELYAKHPELRIKRGELQWGGADEAAALIGPEAAVLEYVLSEDHSWAILLTRGYDGRAELHAWVMPLDAVAMRDRVVELRKKVGERDYDFRKTASDFYDMLVRPAARRLAGIRTLIIVPDGALWELPFQVLHDGHRYMLESHTILYAPSLAVLAAMKRVPEAAPADARLFAVGNPANRNKPLPNAEREVQQIAMLHGLRRSTTLIREQALEPVIRREMIRHAILHFATHGLRDDHDPMRSRVLLAAPRSGEPDDGALDAREFMEIELSASLVVLSACETAVGRVSGGEGMIGLTWALFIAGSPTTVASQWQVDSDSTTKLMIGFHGNLVRAPKALASSIAAANALRQSALQLLRSPATAHPFYWAGFVTVGTRL